jgi:hypothetical protein
LIDLSIGFFNFFSVAVAKPQTEVGCYLLLTKVLYHAQKQNASGNVAQKTGGISGIFCAKFFVQIAY